MNVTMVITTYDRGHLLRHNLRRLAELTIPEEILVIDDGGSDDTEQVCAEAPACLPIRYIYNHNPGPSICSMARNIGVKQAAHDWIVTCEPELLYINDIIARFKELEFEHPKEVISAGRIYFGPPGWEGADARLDEWERAGDYVPPSGSQEAIGWVAPYTALWNKAALIELGGWDEGFPGYWGWDDIDLLTRLRINGIGQYIDLESIAVHQFHGLGGDHNTVNEQYFRAKSFCHGDETKIEDLIANKGKAWGQIIPRS